MNIKSRWLAAAILVGLASIGTGAFAQLPSNPEPRETTPSNAPNGGTPVRPTAEEVLARPEFRDFERLKAHAGRSGGIGHSRRVPGLRGPGGNGGGPGNGGPANPGGNGADGNGGGEIGNGAGADNAMGNGGNDNPVGNADDIGNGENDQDDWRDWDRDGPGGEDANAAPPPNEPFDPPETSSSSSSSSSSGFSAAVGAIFHVLAWAVLGVIVGMIIWLIIKAVMEYEPPTKLATTPEATEPAGELEPDAAPGEHPPDVYVSRARQLADQGKYREAVAHLLLGAMSRLERAGRIRFRRGLTVRDYLRSSRSEKSEYSAFGSMVKVFEPLSFGRREPTSQHFETALAGYESGFPAAPDAA